ncbi:MAG: TonB-dependent receptor [Acidimicrobiia bacterium]|nr:TonB-dependent receptor [Acidimicrobiia bacterium]
MGEEGGLMYWRLAVLGLSVVFAVPAAAQQDPPAEEEPYVYEETIVVTASKTEQELVNAPAAISVIDAQQIAASPVANVGDLLRTVPGVNVMQASARDINITSRGATGTLATSQLALVDGRSIYLDFFGMVMWDLVPTSATDIKQMEVIRGPASAVWGANAMTGVVNVITKTPRELAADRPTTFSIGVGAFNRSVGEADEDTGMLFSVSASHAHVVNERAALKVSLSYLTQDPLPRPRGTIANAFRTPYPPYENTGTSQPKVDGRFDYELPDQGTLTLSGGFAGTEGVIHSGLGPFDIESGSNLTYLSARYNKGGRRIGFFTNLLDGNASNLLSVGADGRPIGLVFDTKTFDVDASDVATVAGRHVISYGGNFRRNTFDISLAADGDDRSEGGAYVQDEIFLSDHFRWVVGGRVDKFSSIEHAVFSPRTTLMIKPDRTQTFRVSFNRAFRAPSFINNHIRAALLNRLNLGLINPALSGVQYIFPVRAVGNPDLEEESMTAFEVGYTGTIRQRATVSAAVYWNETTDGIFFTPVGRYSAASPPPGWPLPPVVLELIAAAGSPLPSVFSYRNLGTVKDKGIELGIDAAVDQHLSVFANYSYQWLPVVEGFPLTETNHPPSNRFNTGFAYNRGRWLGNLTVSYTDDAYWQDVLDARFYGTTEAYTLVNLGGGVRWMDDRVTTSVKVTNLANQEVMQHVFGDVLKRQVVGELKVEF